MTRDRSAIEAALLKKGFYKDDTHHHYYIYVTLDGKKTAHKTRMSHGSSHKTIGDPLIGKMAKQIGLKKSAFLDLIDCKLGQAGYELIISPV